MKMTHGEVVKVLESVPEYFMLRVDGKFLNGNAGELARAIRRFLDLDDLSCYEYGSVGIVHEYPTDREYVNFSTK